MKQLSRSLLSTALLLGGAAPLAACNGITGIGDLQVNRSAGAGGSGGDSSGNQVSVGAGTTDGPATVTSGPPPPPPLVLAQGLSITEIAVYQGVKRDLMANGAAATSKIPVVAGRDGIVRVFYATDGSYDGSPITAHLTLGMGSMPIEVVGSVSGASSDSQLTSTINFDVPGAALVPGLQYRVDLFQPAGHAPGTAAASWPAMGTEAMDVESSGATLKIELIPIAYGADGSNRLPDTTPGQLQAYKEEFLAIYPVPDVEITVHASMAWAQPVDSNGNGWPALLDGITNLRAQDQPATDVYYFGVFLPSASVNSYCGGGCVAGLGNIAGAGDAYVRSAIGLGFPENNICTETAVHEIGHTHGRMHSPCGGAQGTDPAYPYPGAQIGVWGYNIVTKTLYDPVSTTDVMGYCQPIWVSDFTYDALFERLKIVNKANVFYPPELLDRTYDRARLDGQGKVTWLSSTPLHTPAVGEATPLTVQTASGSSPATGQFFPYDHLPGGILVWPQVQGASLGVKLSFAGKPVSATR